MSEEIRENQIFEPSKEFSEKAQIKSLEEYRKLYQESIENPEKFWAKYLDELDWFKKPTKILTGDKPFWKWFEDGNLNVSVNCLDRHLKDKADKPAIIWESEQGETKTYTYAALYREVNQLANALKRLGIEKGDRVCIYLPMIPELAVSLLACARIGAIHSVVFGGFSAKSLADRIQDAGAKLLITSDGGYRGGKIVSIWQNAVEALENSPSVRKVIVVKRSGTLAELPKQKRPYYGKEYYWYHDLIAEFQELNSYCQPEEMKAEDILFLLYTSGTTGKPKGVIHTTAGYLLYTYLTFKWIFDIREDDIYFCTADIGWVTGHSYIVYGPLANGATSLMFEGIPTYPKPDRWWEIIEKYKVTILYTAPTAIRALMREGTEWPKKHDLSSLRLLGSVGEPINPAAWLWYYEHIGGSHCPIVDTWWQTETGGILITPLPGAIKTKPGSATLPFFGVAPKILKDDGTETEKGKLGNLVILKPWPGMFRGIYKNPEKYQQSYFEKFGVYLTGDGANQDEDGYYWIIGRLDDVLNVSGHRIGTAEVESALVSHPSVAEAAVVGFPHEIKGDGIYCYVTLKLGVEKSQTLLDELKKQVRKEIGPIATPDKIQFADVLPKTRSGKIIRRILRKIAAGITDPNELGDTTTLADPSVVEKLIQGRV